MTDLLLLPGDGIGPEVTAQARRVAEALTPDLKIAEGPFGGISFDQHGSPLTDETLAAAKSAKAVLMGAVGGPQWANAPYLEHPDQTFVLGVEAVGVGFAAVFGTAGGQHGVHVGAQPLDIPGRYADGSGDDDLHARSSHGWAKARRVS